MTRRRVTGVGPLIKNQREFDLETDFIELPITLSVSVFFVF